MKQIYRETAIETEKHRKSNTKNKEIYLMFELFGLRSYFEKGKKK